MGWKNLSYWVRGGIIGLVIGFFLVSFEWLGFFLPFNVTPSSVYSTFELFLGNIIYPITETLFFPLKIFLLIIFADIELIGWGLLFNLFFSILKLLYCFVIGEIIGWIYGKIKNRQR